MNPSPFSWDVEKKISAMLNGVHETVSLDDLRHRLNELKTKVSLMDREYTPQAIPEAPTSPSSRFGWPDRFMTKDSLQSCAAFHDAEPRAQFVYDELLAAGQMGLDDAVEQLVALTSDCTVPVQEAAFSKCFDLLMDIIRATTSPRGMKRQASELRPLFPHELLGREFLIQAVASRRPSVKLKKIQDAVQVISESSTSANADDLLDILALILPRVPQIRETATLLRSYVDALEDPSLQYGPIGYSLTSLEAVIGVL